MQQSVSHSVARRKARVGFDHVKLEPDHWLACLNCGQRYKINMPAPLDIFAVTLERWEAAHRRCPPDPDVHERNREAWEAQFRSPEAWISGTDRGTSSETLWHHFMLQHTARSTVPYDVEDFGRCHRLLKSFPEWRARLESVGHRYPEWRSYVAVWGDLEVIFETEVPDFMLWNHVPIARRLSQYLRSLREPRS